MSTEWEDPPPTTRGDNWRISPFLGFTNELRANPKRWAVYPGKPGKATVGNIRRGLIAAFRPMGSFEATRRTVDGEIRVYVRYVGEQS